MHRGLKKHACYVELIDWFGIENLTHEDHQPFKMDNGKMVMSIAEQVYGNYSRLLAAGQEVEEIEGWTLPNGTRILDDEKIAHAIKLLSEVLKKYPDLKFTRYFLYSLYNAAKQPEEAKKIIIPFVKKHSGEFWVWDKLGDAESDHTKRISCYCRALQAKAPDEFLVKIRRKLAMLLAEKNLYNEAKTEINKHIVVMEQNGWSLSNMVQKMKETNWYENAIELPDNNELYAGYRKHTDELLQADLPETLIVVSYVNKNKGSINFYVSRTEQGFFYYTDLIDDPNIGDVYKVRMKAVGQKGQNNVFKLEKSNQLPSNDIVFDFEGTFTKPEKMTVGFIDYGKKSGILVEPNLLKQHNLVSGASVKGRAIISFNTKRNEWGYKAIRIEKI
jgi:tetratricopeptide (TPR) repeat protein